MIVSLMEITAEELDGMAEFFADYANRMRDF